MVRSYEVRESKWEVLHDGRIVATIALRDEKYLASIGDDAGYITEYVECDDLTEAIAVARGLVDASLDRSNAIDAAQAAYEESVAALAFGSTQDALTS